MAEPYASQSPRRAWALGRSFREDRRSRGNWGGSRQHPRESRVKRCCRNVPLAIFDPAQEHCIPQGVHLAPPGIHEIRQELVDLLRAEGRVVVSQCLCTFADTIGTNQARLAAMTDGAGHGEDVHHALQLSLEVLEITHVARDSQACARGFAGFKGNKTLDITESSERAVGRCGGRVPEVSLCSG